MGEEENVLNTAILVMYVRRTSPPQKVNQCRIRGLAAVHVASKFMPVLGS